MFRTVKRYVQRETCVLQKKRLSHLRLDSLPEPQRDSGLLSHWRDIRLGVHGTVIIPVKKKKEVRERVSFVTWLMVAR